jgi:hypothetical protein
MRKLQNWRGRRHWTSLNQHCEDWQRVKYLVDKLINELKFKQSKINECVFYRGNELYVLYTDDSILAGQVANPLLNILVHYPEGQISTFQRKQMTCIDSKVVQVATFQSGGDDMDSPIKNMLAKQDTFSGQYLTGVDSYDFARPMAQIVHHVSDIECRVSCLSILPLLVISQNVFVPICTQLRYGLICG